MQARAYCPQNKGYKLTLSQVWRSSVFYRNGIAGDAYTEITRWQFALELTADFCVSSDPRGNEWEIYRPIPTTVRLQGVTFQSFTRGGQTVFDAVYGGLVTYDDASTRLGSSLDLPEISVNGNAVPSDVNLMWQQAGSLPAFAFGTQKRTGSYPNQAATDIEPLLRYGIGKPCAGTASYGRYTTTTWSYADACDTGTFAWQSSTNYVSTYQELRGSADLMSSWRRTYCPCAGDGGGGTSPQARGGGCAGCGDASSLEVIG